MPTSIATQAYVFLYSVLSGLIIAFIYDLFRIKRKTIKTNSVIVYIEDFIYWIIVSVVMFLLIYMSNDGEIRGYILIGAVLGVVLYILLLSKIITALFLYVIKIVGKAFKLLYKVVFVPLSFVLKIILKPMKLALKSIGSMTKSIGRKTKNRLKRVKLKNKIFRNIRKKV